LIRCRTTSPMSSSKSSASPVHEKTPRKEVGISLRASRIGRTRSKQIIVSEVPTQPTPPLCVNIFHLSTLVLSVPTHFVLSLPIQRNPLLTAPTATNVCRIISRRPAFRTQPETPSSFSQRLVVTGWIRWHYFSPFAVLIFKIQSGHCVRLPSCFFLHRTQMFRETSVL